MKCWQEQKLVYDFLSFGFIVGNAPLTVVEAKDYVLCKDAFCIPSKDRVGEADEGEVSQAFEQAYREANPGSKSVSANFAEIYKATTVTKEKIYSLLLLIVGAWVFPTKWDDPGTLNYKKMEFNLII